jgi:glycerophosphoryl diester phosphodiesterase
MQFRQPSRRGTFWRHVIGGFAGAVLMMDASAVGPGPFVIAHRGASGYVPEHTLAAYFIAIQQGADYIEPDLVITRDGALVARHENEIGGTTDVASRPEFATRRTRKVIDGEEIEGWFTEDFTLAELKTLRAKERLPAIRPSNTRYDGAFQVPTLDEILELVAAADAQRAAAAQQAGRAPPGRIGIYPETKHPSYFAALGLHFDDRLLGSLARHGYSRRADPVFLQSFEVSNLKVLRTRTDLSLVQLVAPSGQPYDFTVAGETRTYRDLMTAQGLAAIATYADAIGPHKWMVVDFAAGPPRDTGLAARAKAAGLGVHVWTLRAENEFLPPDLRRPGDAATHGDVGTEIRALLDAGVTGLFADQPDLAIRAREDWRNLRRSPAAVP